MAAGTGRILTLVRHAKSDWGQPGLPDTERPLNARGQHDAPRMARRTLAADLRPTLILSSPAVRALATATAFAREFGYPARRIVRDGRIYEASAGTLLEVVQSRGGRARHVMLFGHNPGISAFAARLTGDPELADQPTCAVVSLAIAGKSWRALAWGTASLRHHDWPKNDRDPASVRGE